MHSEYKLKIGDIIGRPNQYVKEIRGLDVLDERELEFLARFRTSRNPDSHGAPIAAKLSTSLVMPGSPVVLAMTASAM